jgi:hypothetical protein
MRGRRRILLITFSSCFEVYAMKFQMLEVGARFEYAGDLYVKTGPLTAINESGTPRMIPRFALLRPLDAPAQTTRKPSRTLDENVVMDAFEEFYAVCLAEFESAGRDSIAAQTGRKRLESARQRFVATLENPSA